MQNRKRNWKKQLDKSCVPGSFMFLEKYVKNEMIL